MSGVLATLPVQLTLQLINPGSYNLLNSTLPAAGQPQQARPLPDGYTAFPDIGVGMKYYNNNLTWNLARKHCIREGGDLAVIDSLEKSRYANALRKSNPRGAYLGIHKLFDNTEWVSVKTGLPLAFIPWKTDVIHDATAPSCTYLWGNDGGRVGPAECNMSWTYTCEVPLF